MFPPTAKHRPPRGSKYFTFTQSSSMSRNVKVTLYPLNLMDKDDKVIPGQKETWVGPDRLYVTYHNNKRVELNEEDFVFFSARSGAKYMECIDPEGRIHKYEVVTWPIETMVHIGTTDPKKAPTQESEQEAGCVTVSDGLSDGTASPVESLDSTGGKYQLIGSIEAEHIGPFSPCGCKNEEIGSMVVCKHNQEVRDGITYQYAHRDGTLVEFRSHQRLETNRGPDGRRVYRDGVPSIRVRTAAFGRSRKKHDIPKFSLAVT